MGDRRVAQHAADTAGAAALMDTVITAGDAVAR
jgi:hypothetical protein